MSCWKKRCVLLVVSPMLLLTAWVAYEFIIAESSTNEETEYLFVYGTLKNPVIRFYACRCVTEESDAALPGYKKVGLNIVPEQSSAVAGALLRVTPLELKRLDRYENAPQKYQRTRVTLRGGEEVWVYSK